MSKKNEMQVQTDKELETDAEHPLGSVVHISTASHAWRGTLKFVTPSYFVLEEGAVMVGETGDIAAYCNKKNFATAAEESEPCKKITRIPRGAVCWMTSDR